MYAVITTGGKQYKVEKGNVIKVERLDAEPGSRVTFQTLMTADGKAVKVGDPILKDVLVTGLVIEHGKAKKVIVFKYKAKKDYRKKQGHRQPFTKVEIIGIGDDIDDVKLKAKTAKAAEAKEAAPKATEAKKAAEAKEAAPKAAEAKKAAPKAAEAKKAEPKAAEAKKAAPKAAEAKKAAPKATEAKKAAPKATEAKKAAPKAAGAQKAAPKAAEAKKAAPKATEVKKAAPKAKPAEKKED